MRIRHALTLLLCAAVSWSSACTITGLRHEVTFMPGSAVLQAAEIRSLTDWYVNMRDDPRIDFVLVHAYSIKGNAASTKLTRARANAVAELARTLGASDEAPVNMFLKGVETPRPETYQEVVVSINPKCARTNSCCPQPVQK